MRERERRALLARVKIRQALGDLWLEVSCQGFLVRQHPDRRDIILMAPGPEVALSPEAKELRRRGPEVFDLLEFLGRLKTGITSDVEPPSTRRDR